MITKSVPDASVDISNALDRPETMFALRLFRSLNPENRTNLLELADTLLHLQEASDDSPQLNARK